MIESLDQLDKFVFLFLNGLHTDWLDPVMYLISTVAFWIPFYALLAYMMYRSWGWKKLVLAMLSVALLITLTDQTTSSFFKPYFGRLRPCQPDALGDAVHIVRGHCGGLHGFVSSHAANFFALATFLSLAFRKRQATILFFSLATLVAYSRIYLGVHYPGDVIGGALVGAFFGWLIFLLFVRISRSARFGGIGRDQPESPGQ